jgi:hypothetical protein
MKRHYGFPITEDNHELIKFINGGTLPEGIDPDTDDSWRYFCFSISEGKVEVPKRPIRTWDSLWANDWKIKNDRSLLG